MTDPILLADGFENLQGGGAFHGRTGKLRRSAERNQQSGCPSRRSQPKLRAFLTELRQNAFLQIKPGYVDSGAAPGKDTTWKDPAQLKPQTTTKEAVANQRHFKKFMHVVPYGRTGVKDTGAAAPPEVAPVPATPVQNATARAR